LRACAFNAYHEKFQRSGLRSVRVFRVIAAILAAVARTSRTHAHAVFSTTILMQSLRPLAMREISCQATRSKL
jgi:hypothetical protein